MGKLIKTALIQTGALLLCLGTAEFGVRFARGLNGWTIYVELIVFMLIAVVVLELGWLVIRLRRSRAGFLAVVGVGDLKRLALYVVVGGSLLAAAAPWLKSMEPSERSAVDRSWRSLVDSHLGDRSCTEENERLNAMVDEGWNALRHGNGSSVRVDGLATDLMNDATDVGNIGLALRIASDSGEPVPFNVFREAMIRDAICTPHRMRIYVVAEAPFWRRGRTWLLVEREDPYMRQMALALVAAWERADDAHVEVPLRAVPAPPSVLAREVRTAIVSFGSRLARWYRESSTS